MKLFISQRMNGKTNEEIEKERQFLIEYARKSMIYMDLVDEKIEVIDSFFRNSQESPLFLLGKALELMSTADLVIFSKDWNKARGCRIEHECAVKYNIPYLEVS